MQKAMLIHIRYAVYTCKIYLFDLLVIKATNANSSERVLCYKYDALFLYVIGMVKLRKARVEIAKL